VRPKPVSPWDNLKPKTVMAWNKAPGKIITSEKGELPEAIWKNLFTSAKFLASRVGG
jgi:hypothetical protein